MALILIVLVVLGVGIVFGFGIGWSSHARASRRSTVTLEFSGIKPRGRRD